MTTESTEQSNVLVDGTSTPATKSSQIKNCKFNSMGNSLLVTNSTGFSIFSFDSEGNFSIQNQFEFGSEIKFAERLYSTNLVAYTTFKNPKIFVVFHCKRKKIVCDFRYPTDINIIRFNRQRVIIAIKEVIYIHNVRNMQILHLIKDVPENPLGVLELACPDDCGYLAFPWKSTTGAVRVFDVFQLQDIACIQAHQSPLSFVRFDRSGGRVATASVKGTCIRVFDSSSGNKLFEFRRGFKEVKIVSLSFSLDGSYLSTTSDSETIHIFKLQPGNEIGVTGENSGSFLKNVKTAGGLLNSQERAFITTPSPLHGQNAAGFFGSLSEGVVNFMLISPTGLLKIYSLEETADGSGSLSLIRQHDLREIKKSTVAGKGVVKPFSIT